MPTSSKNGKRSRGRTGAQWEHVRRRVLAANRVCGLCGEWISPDLKFPDPMAGEVDHIVQVADLAFDDPLLTDPENLRSVHSVCNKKRGRATVQREHKWSRDWFD